MQIINHEGNDEVSREKKCGRIAHERCSLDYWLKRLRVLFSLNLILITLYSSLRNEILERTAVPGLAFVKKSFVAEGRFLDDASLIDKVYDVFFRSREDYLYFLKKIRLLYTYVRT